MNITVPGSRSDEKVAAKPSRKSRAKTYTEGPFKNLKCEEDWYADLRRVPGDE
jgi:hypothetical protein